MEEKEDFHYLSLLFLLSRNPNKPLLHILLSLSHIHFSPPPPPSSQTSLLLEEDRRRFLLLLYWKRIYIQKERSWRREERKEGREKKRERKGRRWRRR
jgi:hypothetical protein